ncbi:unnamed protein product, partial [Mesorhabditis spiculigera]
MHTENAHVHHDGHRCKHQELKPQAVEMLIDLLIENWEVYRQVPPPGQRSYKKRMWAEWAQQISDFGVPRDPLQIKQKIHGELRMVREQLMKEQKWRAQGLVFAPYTSPRIHRQKLYDFFVTRNIEELKPPERDENQLDVAADSVPSPSPGSMNYFEDVKNVPSINDFLMNEYVDSPSPAEPQLFGTNGKKRKAHDFDESSIDNYQTNATQGALDDLRRMVLEEKLRVQRLKARKLELEMENATKQGFLIDRQLDAQRGINR